MPLFRLFAYAVTPQRTVDLASRTAPVGGVISIDAAIRQALDVALQDARRARMTRVSLVVDTNPSSRTSAVRDAVMEVAFAGTNNVAEKSAATLAVKLSAAMDHRSPPGLLMVAANRESAAAATRQVAIWVFPRGEGFRFQSAQHRIQLVKDYFDRNSILRKLALFDGQQVKSKFLQADVLDFQASGLTEVAQLWTERFLEAALSITREAGTRMLAKAFSETSDESLSTQEREQLQTAVMALRHTPQQRWSLDGVAQQFLSPGLAARFTSHAPNTVSLQSLFDLDRDLFAATLKVRVFRLDGDVYVSSPLEQIGKQVKLNPASQAGDGLQKLEVKGTVVEDKLRQRRA